MILYEDLSEYVFSRHKYNDSDELVILSGYVGPEPVKALSQLPLSSRVIYGMYATDSIKPNLHKILNKISDSSKNGGTIGWINKNSLNKSILKELSKIKIGEYTGPILTPSGYLILKIENKKKNQTNATDLDNKINRAIRLKTNQQLNQYSNIYLNKLMKDMVINEL